MNVSLQSKTLFRNITILLAAIVMVIVTWSIRNAQSATGGSSVPNKYIEEIQKNGDVDALVSMYHTKANEIFNAKIKQMVAVQKEFQANPSKDPTILTKRFKPPEYNKENGIDTTRKECEGDNLSTYCLALEATKEYFLFRDALLIARTVAEKQAGDVRRQLPDGGTTLGDIGNAQISVAALGNTYQKIEQEADLARQTLDQALAAYDEMQVALPMHTKYMNIVKSLEEYRDKVSDIRKKVEEFPGTFLDVTTTQCT